MRIHANGKSWCRTPAKPTVPSYPTSTKQTNTTNQPFSPKGSQDLQGSLLLVLAIARAKDASPRAKSCTCIECLEKYSDTPMSQDLNGHSVFVSSMYRTHLCLLFGVHALIFAGEQINLWIQICFQTMTVFCMRIWNTLIWVWRQNIPLLFYWLCFAVAHQRGYPL